MFSRCTQSSCDMERIHCGSSPSTKGIKWLFLWYLPPLWKWKNTLEYMKRSLLAVTQTDPRTFAYQARKVVEQAAATLLGLVAGHQDLHDAALYFYCLSWYSNVVYRITLCVFLSYLWIFVRCAIVLQTKLHLRDNKAFIHPSIHPWEMIPNCRWRSNTSISWFHLYSQLQSLTLFLCISSTVTFILLLSGKINPLAYFSDDFVFRVQMYWGTDFYI